MVILLGVIPKVAMRKAQVWVTKWATMTKRKNKMNLSRSWIIWPTVYSIRDKLKRELILSR